jgi:hypothetical protein
MRTSNTAVSTQARCCALKLARLEYRDSSRWFFLINRVAGVFNPMRVFACHRERSEGWAFTLERASREGRTDLPERVRAKTHRFELFLRHGRALRVGLRMTEPVAAEVVSAG